MKNTGYNFLILVVLILTFANCARRGNPDGGAIDELPPEYVRARPENFSTNFDAREIRIYFNEYVKLTDPQRQIIISPPMDPRPEITPLGTASRSIRIRINDTLEPQTTYTINFGRSIIDNNESNPLSFFTYAFSTGPYIDSLTVSGNVSDALLNLPDPFISVMLYEVDSTYTDSAVYNRVPRYVTNTLDSATTFQLNNIKEGTYQLVGIRDLNNNYTFEPETDKIAFADDYITIPTESVFDLILFQEMLEGKFQKPQQKAQQHLILGYKGIIKQDSLSIEALDTPEDFESRITQDPETDTLHYWYKPFLERDSLKLVARSPRFNDTLIVRMKKMEMDSLQFTFEPSGTINFNKDVKVLPNIPLNEVNDSLVSLVDRDTVPVPFTAAYDRWKNEYVLSFEKNESQTYRFTALPGAFTDFFGKQNDTLKTQFRTQAYSDLGNLSVNLVGIENYPVIVQLTSEQGEVQVERYLTEGNSVNFPYISAGNYLLRLIYDENENRVWDTGSYLGKRQPESVTYYPETLEVRTNWDVTETFILN